MVGINVPKRRINEIRWKIARLSRPKCGKALDCSPVEVNAQCPADKLNSGLRRDDILRLRCSLRMSLDPQPQGIPGPPKDAGLFYGLQGEQRHVQQRLVARADLERSYLLALVQGRHERVRTRHLGLDSSGCAGGNGHDYGLRTAQLDGLFTALPDLGRCDRLVRVEQFDAVERRVTPVEQFLRLV